jgi:arylsulfatase A
LSGHYSAQQLSGGLIDATDFLPTLAEAAGIKKPADYGTLDGISFYPLWFGEKKRLRDWIYCYWQPADNTNTTFRVWTQDENYKLYDSTNNHSFFDINTDPLELNRIPGSELTEAEKARKKTFDSVLKAMH